MKFFRKPSRKGKPSSALTLLPLGGVGSVTKNMFVYEYDNDIIIVDCGIGFPDQDLPGIDFFIPDISALRGRERRIRGIFLTHAHEDHMGALSYLLPTLNAPIYATPLTGALAAIRLRERKVAHKIHKMQYRQKVSLGAFQVEAAHVTHSVPDAAAFRITCPAATVVHAADFKFDWTPVDGQPTDVGQLAAWGEDGVDLLLSDCLRVEKKGSTLSERSIEDSFAIAMVQTRGKFLMTTASSNISRIQQAVDVSARHQRRVAFVGRSLEQTVAVALRMRALSIPSGAQVDLEAVSHLRPDGVSVIVAGSQGQQGSALDRIAEGDHRITIRRGDTVVFSADPIPGSEQAVYWTIDRLARAGANVLYSDILDELHVSGHGAQQDLAFMIGLTKPRNLLPIGGNYRHMDHYATLASSMGYDRAHLFLVDAGQKIIVGQHRARIGPVVPQRNVMVDSVGAEAEQAIVRDRKTMAEDGMMIALISIDQEKGDLIGDPDVLIRGLVIERGVYTEIQQRIAHAIRAMHIDQRRDWRLVRKRVTQAIEPFIYQKVRKRPMIIPIVMEG